MKRKLIGSAIFSSLFSLLFLKPVSAHCPLCTAGAAVAAGGAAYLGVKGVVIGLFIGAFAVSTGWWASRAIKKKFIPGQHWILVLSAFLLTIIPLIPLLGEIQPLYISLIGGYGSLLNRTYLLDVFVSGSILGGIIMCITPWLSKRITAMRKGAKIPFQGIMLTFLLLIIIGVILQFTF